MSKQGALVYKDVLVENLKVYENNPRKNDAAVPGMVNLIEQFGFRVPILIRGNRVVDGHLRLKAAKKLNIKSVPAIDIGSMTDAEERALRIAINKSVSWAEWDDDLLKSEFEAIREGGVELTFTGFDFPEIEDILGDDAGVGQAVTEATKPAEPKTTKTKDANAGAPADPAYVSITFNMAAATRDKVMEKLIAIQKAEGLGNPSQAMVHAILNHGAKS